MAPPPKTYPTPIFVVMGTAGCGKTSVAEELQKILGCQFLEGDVLHPQANIEKMASGHPLTDDDRWPWLHSIHNQLLLLADSNATAVVVTCSALRKVYRDFLRDIPADVARVSFVYLKGTPELLLERISHRKGHFMAAEMLRSQLDTLEEPDPRLENVIVADIKYDPTVIAEYIVAEARQRHLLPAHLLSSPVDQAKKISTLRCRDTAPPT